MDYLSRQPATSRRNQMRIKCLQTKAAYYSQFYLDPDSLVYYNIEACKVAEQEPDFEQQILCLNNLADAYRQKGELAQSAFYYKKAIYLADSAHTAKDNYVPYMEDLQQPIRPFTILSKAKYGWIKVWNYGNL